MSDEKIALLAKWFANGDRRFWRENDPDINLLKQMGDVAKEAYENGGGWTEGTMAAADAVIRFVIAMDDLGQKNSPDS